MQPVDLSESDWAALIELRERQAIRVDEAGTHAESLARLTRAELIESELHVTRLKEGEATADQTALGFRPGMSSDFAGRRYIEAPHWFWPTPHHPYESPVSGMLATREGRAGAAIDWDEFCTYVTRSYGQRGDYPTVAMVAKRFGCTIEDVADWVDSRYWAFRSGPGTLGLQHVELEGE